MQRMWLCLFSSKSFENPQWRKIILMQPMWVCLFSGMSFEETFENTQRRKIKQMQTMWLFLFSSPRPSIYQQSRTTSAMKDNCHPWNLSGGTCQVGTFLFYMSSFYCHWTHKWGGGESPKAFVKKFRSFFIKYDSLILKTDFVSLWRGWENAFFRQFLSLLFGI